MKLLKVLWSTSLFICLCLVTNVSFALPQFFTNDLVKSGFDRPISVSFLPDGRALVAQKSGKIYILDPRQASPTSSLYLALTDVNTTGERGLLDIVVDSDFATRPYIYVVYHRTSDSKQYISRFSHNEVTNTADLASEFVVWNDPVPFHHEFHHGGGLSFGPDGNLYLTTGEQFKGPDAQDLTKAAGKIIRIGPDGSIPPDNPFADGPGGNLDEIWGYGLRNPFRARWDIPTSGGIGPRLFIGEVGGNDNESNEDVHIGSKGANFGWPFCEGFDCTPTNPSYDLPLFSYEHTEFGQNAGSAIIGGIVYHGGQFPPEYDGVYFYGDYAQRLIAYATLDSNGEFLSKTIFADDDNIVGPLVDIKEGPDGDLYFLQITSDFSFSPVSGALRRISYNNGNQPPQITTATANVITGNSPLKVKFTGVATDIENDPLKYVWLFGDGQQATGATVSHNYVETGSYQALLQVSDHDKTTTLNSPLTITVGSAPNITINEPAEGVFFRAGETINFSATGSDNDPLTESSYKWTALFLHNDHTHPQLGPVTGSSGKLVTPKSGHSFNTDTGFQLTVEVTDADGLKATKSVDVFPEKVDITFNSQPSDISFFIDGSINKTPLVYDTAIDFMHIITAPQKACLNGTNYSFDNWSNGEAGSFAYKVPAQNKTLTATYTAGGPCPDNTSPLAFADETTVGMNASKVIGVLDNDLDPDGSLNKNSVMIVQQPQHGSVSVDANSGAVTYKQNGLAVTNDNFTYSVLDNDGAISNEATVYLNVTDAS